MNDPRIDEAVGSLPLGQLPKGFVANTMVKISAEEGDSYRAKFRFTEFAMPGFLTLFFAGIGFWLFSALSQSDVLWLKELETEWAIFQAWVPVLDLEFSFVTFGAFILFGLVSFTTYIIYLERSHQVY